MFEIPRGAHLTTALTWKATAVTATFDVLLVWLAARCVPADRFARLKWPLACLAAAFWASIWTYAMWGPWWDLAYHHIFPAWMRWVGPPAYGLLFGVVAAGLWWVARGVGRRPAVVFVLLGGLSSLPGHLFAFYGRGMLDRVPILQGVSAAALLVFGIFEFVVYWTLILLVSAAISHARDRGPAPGRRPVAP